MNSNTHYNRNTYSRHPTHKLARNRTERLSTWVKRIIQPTLCNKTSAKTVDYGSARTKKTTDNYMPDRVSSKKEYGEATAIPKNTSLDRLLSSADAGGEDYLSETFSVQGMCSLPQMKIGKPQCELKIDKIDLFTKYSESDSENIIEDTDLRHEKFNEVANVSVSGLSMTHRSNYPNTANLANAPYAACVSYTNGDAWNEDTESSDTSSYQSSKTSIFSEGVPSVFCQQTLNSSLIGIPPQSIIDNTRYNNTASSNSYRLPVTTMSVASQSVKSYKHFTPHNALNNYDLPTAASIFSGVGTTTSHYNYYYNNCCDSGSNSTQDLPKLQNENGDIKAKWVSSENESKSITKDHTVSASSSR